VESVYHYRHSGQPCCQPAHRARLGRVRVDDGRAPTAKQAVERPQSPQVAPQVDLASQVGDDQRLHSFGRRQIAHIALVCSLHAGDQQRLKARRVQSRRQQDGVDGRSADVQAGDHPRHPYFIRPIVGMPHRVCQ